MMHSGSSGDIGVTPSPGRTQESEELLLASRTAADGTRRVELSVPSMRCGGCMEKIERTLSGLPGIVMARANLSTKRVAVQWRGAEPPPIIEALRAAGHQVHLQPDDEKSDPLLGELIRALAVAGFAASNIMMLSVSVWSGTDAATRDLFHFISALIALPALAYSGRIFFRSAWSSLRRGQTNMDVPISIGVLMAFGLSIYETAHGGEHAYFDASVSLLFFLLIGRTLDHVMRERARVAVKGLASLAARGARVIEADGMSRYVPTDRIKPGMHLLLVAGDRVPVDARVAEGMSEIDCSLVTGESAPRLVAEGAELQAGTLNLSNPLTVVATAKAEDSFLAEMVRMMEAAESGRTGYRRIADRVTRLYAPVVHLTAFVTFLGWMAVSGDVHNALTIAIAVLIITCPCALGLAVPIVQVVAARRLFELGVMVKDGSSLERLAEADAVMFDKTGTLTAGKPRLAERGSLDIGLLAVAAAIAGRSRHPYSQALAAAGRAHGVRAVDVTEVSEHAGSGLEARIGGAVYRLGRAAWATGEAGNGDAGSGGAQGVVLARDGVGLVTYTFEDDLRADAREAVRVLKRDGFDVRILSGDDAAAVGAVARELGLPFDAAVSPGAKLGRIADAQAEGRKVVMVGDGLNDAPALAAAHASVAPASAADVGRNAADLVFLRDSLLAVPRAIAIARKARVLIRENIALATLYNVIAVPIAVMGYVTPLVAALAMSLSSIVVVANALRLGGGSGKSRRAPAPPASIGMPVRGAA